MKLRRRVCFVTPELTKWTGLLPASQAALAALTPEFVRELERGSLALTWLGQTYLQLRARGLAVELSAHFPDDPGVICIYLSPHASRWGLSDEHQAKLARRELPKLTQAQTGFSSFRVALSLDRPRPRTAHAVVFQNPVAARDLGGAFLPHWPQPGLLPRASDRGSRFENVVFVGISHNLDPEIQSDAFREALRELGLRLDVRHASNWADYRETDVVLALRSRAVPSSMLRLKPASKLANAWLAGVPAVLGNEPGYRALGRPGDDYVEADSPRAALEALRALASNAGRVRALVQRGHLRAPEVSADAVARAWVELLNGPIEQAYARFRERWLPDSVRKLGYLLSLERELRASLTFWQGYERELHALKG